MVVRVRPDGSEEEAQIDLTKFKFESGTVLDKEEQVAALVKHMTTDSNSKRAVRDLEGLIRARRHNTRTSTTF